MPVTQLSNFDWSAVDDVLLDMDGTLLDRHFDNYFFEEALPQRYAEKHGLPLGEAQEKLLSMYQAVEGTLDWADLHYWTHTLGIDVVELTREHDGLMRFLPHAVEFLEYIRARGKAISLVTNAHFTNVAIKTAKTGLDRYVDRIVGAFDVGYLKMNPAFWPACQRLVGFDPARAFYLDDDESCLVAARAYGIRHVLHSAKSSSRLPPEPSSRFQSVESLRDFVLE